MAPPNATQIIFWKILVILVLWYEIWIFVRKYKKNYERHITCIDRLTISPYYSRG